MDASPSVTTKTYEIPKWHVNATEDEPLATTDSACIRSLLRGCLSSLRAVKIARRSPLPWAQTRPSPNIVRRYSGDRTGVGVIFGRGEFHADGFGWQPVATFLIRMPVDFPAYGRRREAVFRLCWCLVWWATSWLRVGVWRWRAR